MHQTQINTKLFHRPELLGCASLLALLVASQSAYAQEATPVPPVSVTAAPVGPLLDGSVEAGYRVKDTTAAGPIWSDLPLQDAPYSISVVPSQLIENLQAYQPEDIFKVIPQITNNIPYGNNYGNAFPYIRGFSVTQFTNVSGVTYDGLAGGVGGMLFIPLEDKERVEVLSGVDGFLYGTGSVGGNINYVLKRPTAAPYYSVTTGDNAGVNGYIHGDFSGPLNIPGLADGLIGYRLNIVEQAGHTSIYNQSIQRDLISGAFDIHLPSDILLQLNAEHSNYHVWGITPSFNVNTSINPYLAPPNPSHVFNQPWTQAINQTDTGGLKLTWKLNDIFTIRAAYAYTREDQPAGQAGFNQSITNYSGQLTYSFGGANLGQTFYTNSGYTFLDSSFSTFDIQHKLTIGFTGDSQLQGDEALGSNVSQPAGSENFYNLQSFPEPSVSYYTTYSYIDAHVRNKNYVIGDEIKLNDQFTVLAGGNYAFTGFTYFNQNGSIYGNDSYQKSAITPTVSLIYKALPWLTTYATYQQSLQRGTPIESNQYTTYTNSGTVLPPYIGNQYEIGAKATVGQNMLLTAALFDIDKANIYTVNNNNNTYTELEGGREVHKGIELTVSGKITDDLTIIGGVTLLNPRIEDDPQTPKANGNLAQGVSPFNEKIYVEYNIPYIAQAPWLQGFTLIGGWHWSSSYYINLLNTTKLPGNSVEDLGLRYTTKLYDHPFTLRFNVNNITNQAYWASSAFIGSPRTFLATAEMKW